MKGKKHIAMLVALMLTSTVQASVVISVDAVNGAKIGTVTAENTPYGLLLTPHLTNLPAGVHGFHIHEMPSCADHAMAASGHLDPKKTGAHKGPYQDGHLGDLPVLIADKNGEATLPVLAPRLTEDLIKGHSLMVHAGGDNYSDKPEKLGGGGARLACGVIK